MKLFSTLPMNKWLILCIFIAPTCVADWVLDSENSYLSFVSIKNGVVAEVHRFDTLRGGVNDDGSAALKIGLASVETNIPIRNDRIKSMLFDVTNFSLATASAQLNIDEFVELPHGASLLRSIPLSINLHGVDGKMPASVKVTRTAENLWHVMSVQPLILNAGNYGLLEGIEALRSIAGLDEITSVIPVIFSLEFSRN